MNSFSSTPMLELLERYLSITSDRHQAISSNLANVDTPGYHAKDVDFRSEMRRAMLQTPDAPDAPEMHAVAHDVPGLLERPDGNNVNLEREGMLLSETQMQYQIGVQLVKTQFHRLLSAINEGK